MSVPALPRATCLSTTVFPPNSVNVAGPRLFKIWLCLNLFTFLWLGVGRCRRLHTVPWLSLALVCLYTIKKSSCPCVWGEEGPECEAVSSVARMPSQSNTKLTSQPLPLPPPAAVATRPHSRLFLSPPQGDVSPWEVPYAHLPRPTPSCSIQSRPEQVHEKAATNKGISVARLTLPTNPASVYITCCPLPAAATLCTTTTTSTPPSTHALRNN